MTSVGNRQLRDETYRMTALPNKHLFDVPEERPDYELVVTVRLEKKNLSILGSLTADLANDGMKVREDGNNVIIVRGTPRNYSYSEQDILNKVKKHDNLGAQIVQSKVL